ncbi:MAG TPA: FimV/HubP family polar landmark protein [Gallionella sp.]
MQKSLLKLLLAATLLLSAAVHALGMGGINVKTALGQPLQAEIEVRAVSRTEKTELAARLASFDEYKSAGLQYPSGNRFRFKLETKPNGDPYLQVSSDQPIDDPFVSLLVELTWPSGKMLREYTFLLDPPGYAADQPGEADLHVVAPAAQVEAEMLKAPEEAEIPVASVEPAMPLEAAPSAEGAVAAEAATTMGEPPVADASAAAAEPVEPAVQEAAPKVADVPPPVAEPLPVVPEWVKVPRGSTMYELADQYKTADMSVERMLVAMYRANANEFGGRNMNRIKAGKVLRLPDEAALAKVTQSDAEREIRVQAADWNAYRQKLASAAAVSAQPQITQQVAVGKINSSVIDKAPIAKEAAREVLKLSKGEAPGDQAVAGAGSKGMTEQDKKNAAQEDAIAKAKALEDERMRAAMLEQNLKDAQLLAQLKAEKAELEAKLLAQQAVKPEVKPEAKPETAPAVAPEKLKVETGIQPPAKPPVKPAVVPPPTTEPSLVDQILDEQLYLVAGAGLLLIIGGAGFVVMRRKKKSIFGKDVESEEAVGETTSRLTAPVVPSPDTGDFTQTVMTSAAPSAAYGQAAQEPESVDPISEADLFLSFGRDGQAEEILKEALKTMPSNHQIHLKLLGIYSSRMDADSFNSIARQLKDSGDDYAWEQAVEMGRKLEPNNPMYGGSASMESAGSATMQMPAFDIGGGAGSAAPQKPAALDMDFDLNLSPQTTDTSPEQNFLGDLETTTVLSSSGAVAEQPISMDFDITSTQPKAGAASAEAMDFDVTGSQMGQAKPEAIAPDIDLGMAFTMDFPIEKPAAKPSPEPLTADLSGISLNFDDEPTSGRSSAPSGGEDGQFQDVATKLDLAKAYQEMGDASGAREILDEVMREGNDEQRQAAQALLDQLY